jgi:signal peptide peptidase SppA
MPKSELARLISSIPHLDQYSGVWMVEEDRWRSNLTAIQSMDLVAHIQASQAEQATQKQSGSPKAGKPYPVDRGLARFDFVGTMTKYGSSFSAAPGMVQARRAITQAAADPDVESILLVFDSPGGTSAGARELADAVAKAAQRKRVVAYADDLMASAAYFVASGASEIVASQSAMVGSIGTYAILTDWSGLYAKDGIKVHVIRAGEYKGSGSPGTEITAKQIDELQRIVNGVNAPFVAAVQRGRRLTTEQARLLADGRIHLAADAVGLGLADRIESLEQVIEELSAKGRKRMSDENMPSRQAATFADLKAISGDEVFICEALDKGMTIAEAQAHWTGKLHAKLLRQESELKARDEQIATLTAKVAELETSLSSKRLPGAAPLADGKKGAPESEAGDWDSIVAQYVRDNPKASKAEAIKACRQSHPDAYATWMGAVNQNGLHLVRR